MRIINQQVAECDVMLVMVGRGWLSAASDEGERRLDNPEDFIRLEIKSAIQLDKLVIPVLINKTDMPRASELPTTLKPFARFQAVRAQVGAIRKLPAAARRLRRRALTSSLRPRRGCRGPIVYRILIALGAVVAAACTIAIIGKMSPMNPAYNLSPVTGPTFVGAASVLGLALLLHFSPWRHHEGKPASPEQFKLQAAGALVILGWMLITEVLGELNFKYITMPGSTPNVYNVNQGQSVAYILGAVLGAIAIMAIKFDKKKLRVALAH